MRTFASLQNVLTDPSWTSADVPATRQEEHPQEVGGQVLMGLSIDNRYESNRVIEDFLECRYPEKKLS